MTTVKSNTTNKRKTKIILATITGIIIASSFIPFKKEVWRNNPPKEFGVFEFIKTPFVITDYDCVDNWGCQEYYAYKVDTMVLSNYGCVGENNYSSSCDYFYISKSKKLYSSPEDAYFDRTQKSDTVIEYKDGDFEPYTTLVETNDCYIFGLYCPDGIEYRHQNFTITTNRKQTAIKYTTECSSISDDRKGDYSTECSYTNPQTTRIDSAL